MNRAGIPLPGCPIKGDPMDTSNRYKAELPNSPGFYGSTDGIKFVGGRGIVDQSTIDPDLGLSVEEVVKKLEAAGYTCEIVKDESTGLAVVVDEEGFLITYDTDKNAIRRNALGQIVDEE